MSLLTRCAALFAVLCASTSARAQVELEWDRTLNLPAPERLYAGIVHGDTHGAWYLTGSRAVLTGNNWVPQKPILLRIDPQGLVTSIQDLSTAGISYQRPIIAVDAAGGLLVGGAPGSNDILRLDPSGNVLWSAPFPFPVDQFTSVGFAPGGDVRASAGYPMNVAAWTAGGASLFQHGLPNPGPTSISAISPAGDIAVASRSNPFVVGSVVVYRPDGSVAWTGTLPVHALINALVFTPSGTLVSVGSGASPIPMSYERPEVRAWDALGNPQWTWVPSTVLGGRLFDVALSPDGFIATSGWGGPSGPLQGLAILLDGAGTQQWVRTWSGVTGGHGDQFHSVLFRSSGEIVAGGSTYVNEAPFQLLMSAPSAACWTRAGVLAWGFVGASLHSAEQDVTVREADSGSIVLSSNSSEIVPQGQYLDGGRLISLRPQIQAFCYGDGTGTACPCANNSAAGTAEGCSNSLGVGGRLRASGIASLSADTLVFQGTQMTSGACVYFQGTTRANGGAGSVFEDGKRCAGGTLVRLRMTGNTGGGSSYPAVGDPDVSVQGGVMAAGSRTYQVWYQNATTFCTGSIHNLTNGIEVHWSP